MLILKTVRLGQLARQLNIKTDKIVSFLSKEKQCTIGEHPNTKVPDELVDVVISQFAPPAEEPKTVEEKPKAVEEKKDEPVQVEVPAEEEKKEPEHISAPSLKIDGPKVVGKIDMPDKKDIQVEVDGVVYNQEFLDKKKKDELEAERQRIAEEKERKKKEEKEKREKAIEQRRLETERQEMLKKEEHNILTIEEERKRAAEEKKMREREARLEKKRKQKQKEFYAKQHAANFTPPKKKKEDKPKVEEEVKGQEVIEEKLSPVKRFLKWLNT